MSSFGVEEDVSVHFVIPDEKLCEDECYEDTIRAFQVCVDHSLNPSWILGKDCLSLHPSKADVFVCEEFSGSSFEFLKSFSCIRIIGPRCVLDCLAADIVIPKSKFPLFTLAMRDLFVTTTGFVETAKTFIGEKVHYMGGIYCSEYRQSVTHLVANNLCSAKYEKAVERNIPVMTEQWVETVWEASKKRNVHANDKEFEKFKCPVFHKLVVTCSQIPRAQKENLKSNINNNGGEFCGELHAGRTNVLVVSKPFGGKFTHAKIWKIPCVSPAWVTDSISKGCALPFINYALVSNEPMCPMCSTPERTSASFFEMSASVILPHTLNVNETFCDVTNTPKTPARNISSPISTKNIESPKKNKHLLLIDKINKSDVKKAGLFLDGCNVYLSGFNPEFTEKLRKIINSGGATRFNEITDSVTHVIVGDFVPSDIRILKSQGSRLHVVTVEWLVESIRSKSTAPEDQFSCLDDLPSPIEFQSPLSKKGLLALHSQNDKSIHSNKRKSPIKPSPKKNFLPKVLFDEYLNPNIETEEKSRSTTAEPAVELSGISKNDETVMINNVSDDNSRHESNKEVDSSDGKSSALTPSCSVNGTQAEFFSGITFSIAGYTAHHTKEIEKLITSCGGRVVTRRFKGIPDYGVVPIHGATLFHTTTEIVTHLWLDECAEEGMSVPVKYYHQPVNFVLDAKPLSGCVVTTTSYSGIELRFVTELLEGLGAINQSMMARINRPADKLLATTHLICPADIDLALSRKYKAACKWGIPSISHQWLLSCAKEKKQVDEEAFVISPDTHDSSVVIAKTPMTHGTKRKYVEDNTVSSRTETPASYSCAQAIGVLQTINGSQAPSTPNQNPPITPVFKTPRQIELRTPGNSATNTPEDTSYHTPRSPGDIPTPDTPYGRVFTENPSPKTRKMWKKWIDHWPEEPEYKAPPPRERRNSTPMTVLFHKCWQKFAHEPYMKSFHPNSPENENRIENADREIMPSLTDNISSQDASKTEINRNDDILAKTSSPTPGAGINTQLQELHQILNSASKTSVGKRKDSDSDALSTPHSARNAAPESLDLCTDLVEWVDPVISNRQKPNPVFMLTSLDNREQYEEIIVSLGGTVCSSSITSFDQTATHLVCQQPSRNEKILSSIAAGKWVLEKSYLEKSMKDGHFLEEEDYEWGNPKAAYLHNLVKPGSLNEQLAKAVHRWRCKIQATGKKAFAGMKAIVCSTKDKSELYKRIIIAGGGEVLNISPPFSEPGSATVCVLELSKVQHRVDLQTLIDKKVPCVAPLYLNDYLIADPLPDIWDCLIPEYVALKRRDSAVNFESST